MSLVTINVLANDEKLDQIIETLSNLTTQVNIMSVTVDQIQNDLATTAANNAASLAALQEGIAELSGIPAQLKMAVDAQVALQSEVASLQAQLSAAGTPVPQSLIDAVAAAKAGSESVLTAAQSIANIVPNPAPAV